MDSQESFTHMMKQLRHQLAEQEAKLINVGLVAKNIPRESITAQVLNAIGEPTNSMYLDVKHHKSTGREVRDVKSAASSNTTAAAGLTRSGSGAHLFAVGVGGPTTEATPLLSDRDDMAPEELEERDLTRFKEKLRKAREALEEG